MNLRRAVLVVVYPILTGEGLFAEIAGDEVVQFGPYESMDTVRELVRVLFPNESIVELGVQRAPLDSAAVTILANAATCPAPKAANE